MNDYDETPSLDTPARPLDWLLMIFIWILAMLVSLALALTTIWIHTL